MPTNIDLFFESYLKYIVNEFALVEQMKVLHLKESNAYDKAFELFSIATILWKSFADVYNDINTGWMADENFSNEDGWFDGIYLEESWPDSYILHVFQCKNKSTLSPKEINEFISDVDMIFSRGWINGKPLNKKTTRMIDDYRQLKSKYIEKRIYFVYNGDIYSNSNDARIKQEYEQNNEKRWDYKFFVFDKNDIYNEIGKNLKSWWRQSLSFIFDIDKSNISFWEDIQSLISYSVAWAQSYVFKISALEICRMIEEEEKLNHTIEYLYSKNIRGFLGFRAKPNKKMKETINDKNEVSKFYLYNNWLTIICDSLKAPTLNNWKYNFKIENPVIVNWLQTSQVLYDHYKVDKNSLNSVFILVRLCQTTDEEIVKKITETTNNQSAINFSDQLSNEEYSAFAKELFKTIWVNYVTKRGDIFNSEAINNWMKDVSNDTLLKFWFATFFEKPTVAKNSIRKVTETILAATNDSLEPLSVMFEWWKDALILKQLLQTYYIYDYVVSRRSTLIQNEQYDDFILSADEIISYWIYKKLLQDHLEINTENIESTYQVVYDTIKYIIIEEQNLKAWSQFTYSHNNYFKNVKSKYDLDAELWFLNLEDSEIVQLLLR